jgi:YbgC/YbaW family acyl-CoA thioester hydrolase
MQGIVYNAHYLTFVDDAFDCWLRDLDPVFENTYGWEVMVKKAEITWESPARFGDHVNLLCTVDRWGNTSFDGAFEGTTSKGKIFTASVTYVCVTQETYQPIPIPPELRKHLTPEHSEESSTSTKPADA